MCRPHFLLATVLMLRLVTATTHAQQDGIVLDQWEILDTSAVNPSAMADAAGVPEQPAQGSVTGAGSQRQLLSMATEDVQSTNGTQQPHGTNMMSAGLHSQFSRKRSLLEANSKQLSVALDAINQHQAAASAGTAAGNSSGRRLRAANITVQQDLLAVGGRYNLLASDAWNVMYGLLKAVRAAFTLLSGWFTATATGSLYIDNTALLRFATDLADLQGQLADTLSKLGKLNADAAYAVTPLTLALKKTS